MCGHRTKTPPQNVSCLFISSGEKGPYLQIATFGHRMRARDIAACMSWSMRAAGCGRSRRHMGHGRLPACIFGRALRAGQTGLAPAGSRGFRCRSGPSEQARSALRGSSLVSSADCRAHFAGESASHGRVEHPDARLLAACCGLRHEGSVTRGPVVLPVVLPSAPRQRSPARCVPLMETGPAASSTSRGNARGQEIPLRPPAA
eukprot:scaffold2538_cov235-Pinguiococcus_pyrenoidosus.AAC.12